MYCEECGKKIPDDSRFCDGCGAPVRSVEEPLFYEKQPENPYGAPVPGGMIPEKEKKGTGTTALIVILSIVAVALVAVLIFLGVHVFGGKGGKNQDMAAIEAPSGTDEKPQEETAEETEKTEADSPSVASSSAVSGTVTTDPATTAASPTASLAGESEYILPNSNSAYLTEADLAGLTRDQLRIARNEIYARRGRKFNDAALNEYFSGKSWYTPLYEPNQFNESVFNDYELANRKLIADYEKKMGY